MNGIRRVLIFFFLILCLCGCDSALDMQDSEAYYYLTTETLHALQVWQVALDGSNAEMIHSIPKWTGRVPSADSNLYGPEIFEHKLGQALIEKYSQPSIQTVFYSYIEVNVSPDKNLIAYNERYVICPGNWCEGLYVMRVYNLKTNVEVMRYYSSEPMGFRDWSANSRYIMFEQLDDYIKLFTYTIHVWDIEANQEILVVAGENSKFIGDTSTILAGTYEKNDELSCCQIVHSETGEIEYTLFQDSNLFGNLALSSNGKKLAVITNDGNENQLRIVNRRNLKDQFYGVVDLDWQDNSLGWSFDDRYLAGESGIVLHVIDGNSGEVISNREEVIDWSWSSNGRQILYLTEDFDESVCVQKRGKIYVWNVDDDTETELPIPDDVRDYIREHKDSMICMQFMRAVDW